MRAVLSALAISGSGSLATMLLGAITIKIIAVLGGPAGIALFAQLRQMVQWFVTLATLNGQVSLVRGIACRDGRERVRFIGVVASAFLVGALVVSLIVATFAPVITRFVFGVADSHLVLAVRCSSVVIVLGATAALVVGIINGYRELKTLALIQVAASIIATTLAYPLSQAGHPIGYLGIVAIGFFAVTMFGAWCVGRTQIFVKEPLLQPFPVSRLLKDHASYSGAALISGLVGAGSVLLIRAIYIRTGGLSAGGYFDAAWTLSMMYVMLILSSFGTYYFPTLSSKKTQSEIDECVNQVFRVATLLATALVSFVVIVKHSLISVLYSDQFEPAVDIVRWMLIGDYIKISSWVFGMLLLSFAERGRFLITELLYQGVLVCSVTTMIDQTMEIAGIAFLGANAAYLVYVWIHGVRRYGIRIKNRLLVIWGAGFSIVMGLSMLTWHQLSLDLVPALIMWLLILSLFSVAASNAAERWAFLSWARSRLSGG